MKNNISLIELFKESFNINESDSTKVLELDIKMPSNSNKSDKSNKTHISITIPDNDKIEELYKIIATDTPEALVQFIKDNKDINLNTNQESFSNNSYMTPLALAIYSSFVSGEMIDDVLFLLSKGAKKSENLTKYVESLESQRVSDNIDDWDEWDTIRDLFDVEKEDE